METLRLPETCKVDFAEEEAEGVDEDMMVTNQPAHWEDYYLVEGRWAQDPVRCWMLELSDTIFGNHRRNRRRYYCI